MCCVTRAFYMHVDVQRYTTAKVRMHVLQSSIGDGQFAAINQQLQASASADSVAHGLKHDSSLIGSIKVYTTAHVGVSEPRLTAAVKRQNDHLGPNKGWQTCNAVQSQDMFAQLNHSGA